MRKCIFAALTTIVITISLNAFSGDRLRAVHYGALSVDSNEVPTQEVLKDILASLGRETFSNNDSTFELFESFFRRFFDAYQVCMPARPVIRELDEKKKGFFLTLNYPFLEEEGCEIKDDLKMQYMLEKLEDDGVEFAFKNHYGFPDFLVETYVNSKFKDVVPSLTKVSIFFKAPSAFIVTATTEAFDNVEQSAVDEHNRNLVQIIRDLLKEKFLSRY